ncbi:MAG: hypothetical protein JNJ63_11220 [Hyphomonadaceae bacterium]|nr:hypothetical protein [Hyphomonadaceae bacterium]
MKHVFFIAATLCLAGLVCGVFWVDLRLYEPPATGAMLPDALPGAVGLLIQGVFDDSRQTVTLNLSVLGAAAFLSVQGNPRPLSVVWIVRGIGLMSIALLSLASVYCAALTSTAVTDMLALGVFEFHHPWLIWPLRLQFVFLVLSTLIVCTLAAHAFVYGRSEAS